MKNFRNFLLTASICCALAVMALAYNPTPGATAGFSLNKAVAAQIAPNLDQPNVATAPNVSMAINCNNFNWTHFNTAGNAATIFREVNIAARDVAVANFTMKGRYYGTSSGGNPATVGFTGVNLAAANDFNTAGCNFTALGSSGASTFNTNA